MSAPHATPPPVLLGDRYRLDALIGTGGMGRVHRAWDTRLGRRVAVKVLSPELTADPEVATRLRAEGRLLATLQHPNLVTLHDIPDDPAITYLVMELVEGESLAARLRRDGPLAAREVSAIITGVAAGLSALHGAGIVHGDVSPANVLLGADGRARLADLGLARDVTAAAPAADGLIHGTLRYLAPERLEGAPASPAADVYALAAVTYAALVGRPPAVATDVIKLRAALAEPPIRPSLLRSGLAPALDEALLAALGPAEGRPSAYHLAVALAQALRASVDPAGSFATTMVVAAPTGVRYRTVRGRAALGRGRRTALALTAGALLLAAGGASLAGFDSLLARPGLPSDAPLTAVGAPEAAGASEAAEVSEATATDPERIDRADTETETAGADDDPSDDDVTEGATVFAGAARVPAGTLDTATLAGSLARTMGHLRAAGDTPSQPAAQVPAGLPRPMARAIGVRPAPAVQLPATVATSVSLPAVADPTRVAATMGGDVELASGVAPHTRAAATTRFASSHLAAGSTPTSVRAVVTATVVRDQVAGADRSGRGGGTDRRSGRADAKERSGRSGDPDREDADEREDAEDREDTKDREDRVVAKDRDDQEDDQDHSGKG